MKFLRRLSSKPSCLHMPSFLFGCYDASSVKSPTLEENDARRVRQHRQVRLLLLFLLARLISPDFLPVGLLPCESNISQNSKVLSGPKVNICPQESEMFSFPKLITVFFCCLACETTFSLRLKRFSLQSASRTMLSGRGGA